MSEALRSYRADPHRFGPGKVHIIDSDDPARTFCGRLLSGMPGREVRETSTCLACGDSAAKRPERRRQEEEWRRQAAEREQQNQQWWEWYSTYLQSPEWRAKRIKVLRRANGRCEGCAERRATQVHHVTYDRVGQEMLFDLVAICDPCHEVVTRLARERGRGVPPEGSV